MASMSQTSLKHSLPFTFQLPTSGRLTVVRVAQAVGALALFAVGGIHFEQYEVANFSVVPTIGPLFLANFIGATALGLVLLVPLRRSAGRGWLLLDSLVALAGIGLSVSAFVLLLVSEQTPIFGFMEFGYRLEIVLALVAEAIATVSLAVFVASIVRWTPRLGRQPAAAPRGPTPNPQYQPTKRRSYLMTRTRLPFGVTAVVIAALVAIIAATSGGAAKASHPAVAAASSISVKQTSLGKTVVDANGRVLYLFEADERDRSTLSSAGQAIWPLFTAATRPAAGVGVNASEITLIKSAGARSQVAYNGHPLYYYVGDQRPGQANGQGLKQFGALWYVLSPAGTAITSAPKSSAAPTPSGSATGYNNGY